MSLQNVIETAESKATANLCGVLIHSYVTAPAECLQLSSLKVLCSILAIRLVFQFMALAVCGTCFIDVVRLSMEAVSMLS